MIVEFSKAKYKIIKILIINQKFAKELINLKSIFIKIYIKIYWLILYMLNKKNKNLNI